MKQNAAALILAACESRDPALRLRDGDAIYMSSVTDPYQPLEARLGLTRGVLEALIEAQRRYGITVRLTVQTRSPIATRDIDLFQQFKRIRVNFSVPTDSEDVRLRYEPHAPAIAVRLKAAAEVAAAGVPIGISVSPLLPIRDVEPFAQRIAALNAAEYVTEALQPVRRRYAAGSSTAVLEKASEDNWGPREYAATRATLARILGPGRQLLEGSEGFAPA